MRRFLTLILATASTGALAAIPVASAQAACGPSFWSVAQSWTHNDAFLFQASSDAAGDAMAAGYRYVINTAYDPMVVQWTGTKWAPMTVPAHGSDAILSGIAVNSASSAVAVGYFAPSSSANSHAFAEIWNGSSWTVSFPPTFKDGATFEPTSLTHAASTSASNVWAVGFHITSAHVQVPLIEHYSNGAWSVASNTQTGAGGTLNDVATDTPSDAWAVGSQNPTVSSQAPFAKHYTGTGWQTVSTPSLGTFSELDGVGIAAATDAWGVGSSFNGSIRVPIAMHWDGAHWSLVTVPNPSANGASLSSVTALGSKDVWAFGTQRTDQFGHSGPLIEHWNGTAWSIVPGASSIPPAGDDGFLDGSTFARGRVLTVGYTEPQGTSAGSTASQELCPVQVTDSGYSPTPADIALGAPVYWSVLASDAGSHAITDGQTGLFNSGVVAPGGSFTFQFKAAGNYEIVDTPTGRTGRIVVPMSAQPASGSTTTTFALQWATTAPPAGDVYDVVIKRPGDTAFSTWKPAQTTTGTNFIPDAGPGTYSFEARLRRLSPKGETAYSPPSVIAVS